MSSEVIGYEQGGASVTARLASGERVSGSLLVGADGLWSSIRKQVVGDGPPRVSGHTTYRSVIPTERMPQDLRWNAATLWAGPKCHLVHYPLSGWKTFNLVVTCHNDAREPVAGKPVSEARCAQVSSTSTNALARSSAMERTGGCGCCATAILSRNGPMGGSRCWATQRTRCCNTLPKVPAWLWRMPSASRTRWRRTRTIWTAH